MDSPLVYVFFFTLRAEKNSGDKVKLKLTVAAQWQKDYAEGEGSDVSSVHSFSSFGSGMSSMEYVLWLKFSWHLMCYVYTTLSDFKSIMTFRKVWESA